METVYANQSRAAVQGDQAGRDIFKNEYNIGPQSVSQVSLWLKKLEIQIKEDNKDIENTFVDNLRYFVDQRDQSEIVGLKAKIEASGYNISYTSAILRKEEFVKLLLKYQEFSSAQELFAYFLSIIHDVFEEKICPIINSLDFSSVQNIVDTHIIDKIFIEIGAGSEDILINRNHVRGMIYWLADKCYVRWH